MSTAAPSQVTIDTPSSRVIGIGIGTFIVFFLAFINAVVWILSVPCFAPPKVLSRLIAFIILVVVSTILLFAEKEDKVTFAETVHIYDSSIIPRVAICIMMVLFGIYAAILRFGFYTEPKKLSSMDTDVSVLWQD